MENEEIKLTKKQIKEMDAILRAENALIQSERTHIAAMAEAAIRARLAENEEFRKKWVGMYRKMRRTK